MTTLEELRHELPNLPKKLALAARYALDHPDKMALQSMRGTAAAVGVTSTTMLRLARHMGFDGYESFRSRFQEQLVQQGFSTRADALQAESLDEDAALSHRIIMQARSNLLVAAELNDAAQFSEVAALMRAAPACYVVGSGSLFWVASIMQNTGNFVLPNLKLVGAEHLVASEAMGQLSPGDVVIGLSINPCATRTVDALSFAKTKGAQTVAITDRPSSPLAVEARYVFCGSTDSHHYYPSTTALMAIVEALLATVVAEGDGSEVTRIKEIERQRKASAAYVEY